ncbi:MAG: helix-turn-helix domain-containing protein [Ruminococcus sp.]|nr:helix-turn-helix domain-containing protein [Ruminococcus sp.]
MKNEHCFAYFNEERFAKRLTELRQQKGVSARDMSLTLGQSEGYINKIENGYTLPSMSGFFYICEYLSVTPSDFFSYGKTDPQISEALVTALEKLSPHQSEHILAVINDILS